jgi:hypothetical protein
LIAQPRSGVFGFASRLRLRFAFAIESFEIQEAVRVEPFDLAQDKPVNSLCFVMRSASGRSFGAQRARG